MKPDETIPPLAEQHRIVARVDALMALCERLEASLAAATSARRRLLIAEALDPAHRLPVYERMEEWRLRKPSQ